MFEFTCENVHVSLGDIGVGSPYDQFVHQLWIPSGYDHPGDTPITPAEDWELLFTQLLTRINNIEPNKREREMFYLTMHSTHFIYGYMASDIWLRTILIVRKETCCRHIGYSYRLTARVLLYAPSHSLCYTSRGALAGTRNSSMGPPHEGSKQNPITTMGWTEFSFLNISTRNVSFIFNYHNIFQLISVGHICSYEKDVDFFFYTFDCFIQCILTHRFQFNRCVSANYLHFTVLALVSLLTKYFYTGPG